MKDLSCVACGQPLADPNHHLDPYRDQHPIVPQENVDPIKHTYSTRLSMKHPL